MHLDAWKQFLAGVVLQRALAVLALVATMTFARATIAFPVIAADFLGVNVPAHLRSISHYDGICTKKRDRFTSMEKLLSLVKTV